MLMAINTEREVAEHSVEIKHMQADIDHMMEDIDEMKAQLKNIEYTLSEIRGGWKVLIGVAGIVGAVVSYVVTNWIKN